MGAKNIKIQKMLKTTKKNIKNALKTLLKKNTLILLREKPPFFYGLNPYVD